MPDNAMQRKIAIQLVSVDKTNHFIRWIVLSTFPTTRVRSNQLTVIDAVYLFSIIMDGRAREIAIIRQEKQHGHPGVSHCIKNIYV